MGCTGENGFKKFGALNSDMNSSASFKDITACYRL